MQNESVKVLNVTVKPIGSSADPNLQEVLQGTAQAMSETLNSFSDEAEKEKKAKDFLNRLKGYVETDSFKKDIEETAKKHGVPPKKLAQNFFEKALGTVGDILGVAVSAISNAGHTVINIASTVAHGIINLITNIANALCCMVTFNKTCVA